MRSRFCAAAVAGITVTGAAAGPALATPEYVLPTLFDVSGVSAGDRLNIRDRPSASGAVIGTLAPDATGVEVVAERNGWAMVNTAERAGWVNARYLAYRTDVWTAGALPATLNCLGTEPFWALRQVGTAYSVAGALLSTDKIMCRVAGPRPGGFFCSQLVFEAFVQAGAPLSSLPSQCVTPADAVRIAAHSLTYVGHLKGSLTRWPILSP